MAEGASVITAIQQKNPARVLPQTKRSKVPNRSKNVEEMNSTLLGSAQVFELMVISQHCGPFYVLEVRNASLFKAHKNAGS